MVEFFGFGHFFKAVMLNSVMCNFLLVCMCHCFVSVSEKNIISSVDLSDLRACNRSICINRSLDC